jgi:tRNA modification GTPase
MDFTSTEDTICAIATPVGEGGIGIIKISGPAALPIALKLFKPTHPVSTLKSHRLYHGRIIDPASGFGIDEVLVSYMKAPRTYTCEDVVEINCHSGFAVLNRMLELVIDAGARLAQPGEFTRRSFLNGRIDLSQAEAVIELIHARSSQSLMIANRQLRGSLRRQVTSWRETALTLQSRIEATIDFSEDLDEEPDELQGLLITLEEELIAPIEQMLSGYEDGRILREGLTLVLIGKPNVGKSSLLNGLLGKDRAIVTPIPGTTRDVIEDSFILSGVTVRILDTAGIRNEPDEIESIGIGRTLRSIEDADAVLWLIDRSRPLSDEEESSSIRATFPPRYPPMKSDKGSERMLPLSVCPHWSRGI